MWLTKSQYRQVIRGENAWSSYLKKTKARRKKKGFKPQGVPVKVWIARRQADNAGKYNLVYVYISGDHLGKIEDAPVFWKPAGAHFYERLTQSGKVSIVRHLPRNAIKVSVSSNWWRVKFRSAS